ncbi:helix-turn-helix domain-containing protein [Pseudoflavonifractor sp. MSJ-30]|nr:helix-turn-helix domain-containing protein [Pseudoflavonifractor sp. MSJ-30]
MTGNKLKGKIAEAGYSQRSLAEALGMSKNTLNSKVNGKIPFNTVEIQQICARLGIHDLQEKASIFLDQSSQK